ncbi:MAG: hypothetical protein HYW78_00220 [Parcubacteria group bacterium]|nr:hypothetical protein [Parcubacteria group bacterium]
MENKFLSAIKKIAQAVKPQRGLTLLEGVGVAAMIVLVFNLFFTLDVKISSKRGFKKVSKIPQNENKSASVPDQAAQLSAATEKKVLPDEVIIPIKWGDLGKKLIESGVIDKEKFESIYAQRGGLPGDMKKLLFEGNNGEIKMTRENAPVLLNILWALGLGNKNEILEKGPMSDPQYGGAGNFASTGGWPLAKGDAMDHYSKHSLIVLTPAQQKIVEDVSKNIYRPCCGNSVYFPDCNHGMAMLGLLELLAANGVKEDAMYQIALGANAYWFPDTYLTIAKFLEAKGIKWEEFSPQDILGYSFSSSAGYRQIVTQVAPQKSSGGGGCGA